MQSFDFKKLLPHLLTIIGFAVLSLFFCYPQLEGKKLDQGDTKSWQAMSQEGKAWHEKTGDNVLWSNSMFGGMPTYTYYVPEGNNYVFKVLFEPLVNNVLGKPTSFLFMGMLCFYILMCCIPVNRWIAITGAIAYGLMTFNIVSVVAGHETKVFALAFLPTIVGGLILLYRSKWWSGIPLLGIGLALMISFSHYQVIYYAIIIIAFLAVGYFIEAIKEKRVKEFFISSAVALVVAIIAVGPSMASILSTMEYGKMTMRGGGSELTLNHEVKKSGGLDKEYAFAWSSSIGESLTLMIPGLYGGSISENLGEGSHMGETLSNMGVPAEAVENITSRVPLYWGPQPWLDGPVYVGAIMCFLFVLGIMVVRSPHKWWMVALVALSLVMSWGKHFPAFNYFLFDTLPGLNRFRTPMMVLLAMAQLFIPLLGLWALNDIIEEKISKEEIWKKVRMSGIITAGLCVVLAFGGSAFFSYKGERDAQTAAQYAQALGSEQAGAQVLNAIREDRAAMVTKSALTSAFYILLAGGLLWAFSKNKVKGQYVVAGIGLLVAIDMISMGSKYMGERNYVDESEYETSFMPRDVDRQIMQDPDPYYRVLDVTVNTYNDAIPSYFHKTIGGYSPAKLEIIQDLIDIHLNGSFNAEVLNMLNTKYVIFPGGQGGKAAIMGNAEANGNAWFVNEVKWVNTADEEILALNAKKLGDTASTTKPGDFNSKTTAVIRNTFKNELNGYSFGKDSAASVKLSKYGLNELEFQSNNAQNGLAVFSDIYYPYGWTAYVDGKETPIMKANYVLRAIKVPAGTHKIEFKFHPKKWYTGNTIAMITSLILLAIFAAAIYQLFRKQNANETGKA